MNCFQRTMISGVALALAIVMILAPAAALAEHQKSGTVSIDMTQVAFIVGVQWGEGVLTLNNGKKYKFKVTGLQAVGIGASEFQAKGRVYDLKKVSDFGGIYMSFKTDAALGGGAGFLSLKNGNDVVMILETIHQGINLTIGGNGINIKFE